MTGPWDDPNYVPDPGGAPTPWPPHGMDLGADPILVELGELRDRLALVERRLALTRVGLALITVGYFLILVAGALE